MGRWCGLLGAGDVGAFVFSTLTLKVVTDYSGARMRNVSMISGKRPMTVRLDTKIRAAAKMAQTTVRSNGGFGTVMLN